MRLTQLIVLVLTFVGSAPVLAASKTVYLPTDHLRLPLIPGLVLTLGEGPVRAEYKPKTLPGKPSGGPKNIIHLSRQALKPGQMKEAFWQAMVRRDLARGHQNVQGLRQGQNGDYQVSYRFTENLMPVDGVHFFHQEGSFLYDFSCKRESEAPVDVAQWCLKHFAGIQWPSALVFKNSASYAEALRSVEQLPLEKGAFTQAISKQQALLQSPRPASAQIVRFFLLQMVRSLLFPPPKDDWLAVLIENFRHTALLLGHNPAMEGPVEWLKAHADFLEGTFTLKKAEVLAQSRHRPPFWMLSLWTESLDRSIALNLAQRQALATPLHHYVLGKLLFDSDQAAQSIPHLKNAAQASNTLALAKLAQAYFLAGQKAPAQVSARAVLKKDPSHTEARLLMATLLATQEKTVPKAKTIYDQLASEKSLSKDFEARLYRQQARTSKNPEEKLALYERVLEYAPADLETLYALGRLYLLERSDKKKSLRYFKQYLASASSGDPKIAELTGLVKNLEKEIAPKPEWDPYGPTPPVAQPLAYPHDQRNEKPTGEIHQPLPRIFSPVR